MAALRRSSRCIRRAQSSFSISTSAFQFAQMVRVAERVQHACHRVVGMPVVVAPRCRPPEPGRLPRLAADLDRTGAAWSRRYGSHCVLPPIRKAGLVHMLDRRNCHLVTHDIGEALEALGAVVTGSGK